MTAIQQYNLDEMPTFTPDFTLPRHCGIGLKPEHFSAISRARPNIGFVEVHAENFFVDGGPFQHYLTQICEDYPLSIHGVGLSLGGDHELDKNHLKQLKRLLARYQPASFSEHLAWSSHAGQYLNDLLPLPYTTATLKRVCEHIDQTQEFLGRKLLLENPATYLEFAESTYSETAFITEIMRRTGCGLLLDVNNVYVSCVNHQWVKEDYINQLPIKSVGEIHLAGHTCQQDINGNLLIIDSHDQDISEAVWELYAYTLLQTGPQPTLIERDSNIPPLSALLQEVQRAEEILSSRLNRYWDNP